jgi:fucose permease
MMILNAMAENVKGIFIPLFKNDFSVNDTQIGYMLTISSLGYIIFTYIGGMLCEKLGQKKVFVLGFLSLILSLAGLGIGYNYILFLASMFLMNVGLALISIAINTVIPVLFISFQAVLMNLTHFCYGLGSTIIQRLAGELLFRGMGWRVIYLAEAALILIVLILFMPVKIPYTHKSENKENNKSNNKNLFKNRLVYFYMIGLGFYVFAEIATGNWFVNFIEKTYAYDKSRSSFYLALFFGLLTFGRLSGGFVAEKLGYLKTVIGSLIIAFILFITGLTLGESGVIIISLSGLFFAVTFPTVLVTVSKVFKENSAYATGIIVTATSTTNMILNMLMGYLNDNIGVNKAFYLIPISLVISILFISALYKNVKAITK